MRLFTAIVPPGEVLARLCQVQALLGQWGSGRFSPRQNLHLTLAFFGEVPQPQPVVQALQTIDWPPLQLQLEGPGSFGDLQHVRLRATPPLQQLHRQIAQAAAQVGFILPQREFVPHITLCRRYRASCPADWTQLQALLTGVAFCAREFVLMQSLPDRSGVRYVPLARFSCRSGLDGCRQDGAGCE